MEQKIGQSKARFCTSEVHKPHRSIGSTQMFNVLYCKNLIFSNPTTIDCCDFPPGPKLTSSPSPRYLKKLFYMKAEEVPFYILPDYIHCNLIYLDPFGHNAQIGIYNYTVLILVKPLIANCGPPLHSGQISCLRLLFLYIWNLREADTSLLQTTDSQCAPK